jgi:DNA polymerase sigma
MNQINESDFELITGLKKILVENFPALVVQIYGYGSRITLGKQDSDFDVVVITSRKIDWTEKSKLFEIIFDYGIENNIIFDTRFFSIEEFDTLYSEMPLIKNVRTYGIAV